MDVDEILASGSTPNPSINNEMREKVYAIVAGGKSKNYLGRCLTLDEVQAMSDEEIQTLYARYETLLGSKMVKCVGESILKLYTSIAGKFFPVDKENLLTELNSNPIVTEGLSMYGCALYHRFGAFMMPAVIGLLTINNFQPKKHSPVVDESSETKVGSQQTYENKDK